jgi:homogentisate 1,2-dioxygenase
MAFMFESCMMLGVAHWALSACKKVQKNYDEESWESLKPHFVRPSDSELRKSENGMAGTS